MREQSTTPPPELLAKVQDMLRAQEAREKVRRQQQGYGRPIISTTFQEYRFVAVGATLFWSKKWLVFPDFLLYFLKKTLGFEWGIREKSKGEHPVFRWLEKFQDYSNGLAAGGKLKTGPMLGFFACWLHLAYALYLIRHHDRLPKRLLRRLRASSSFMPAYFEAIVGAALAVAGFELSSAETTATDAPTPEFRARSRNSGKTYEVEAKRKDRWIAPTHDPENKDFEHELESYVRDQIYRASKKRLTNPIYCLELSIPTLTTEAAWRTIASKVTAAIRNAERTITVNGEPLAAALVLVTNHTFLVNEDIEGAPLFGLLETIRIDDYPLGRPMEIEAALAGYDKYRDVFWLMDAWSLANLVPTTFDGSPPELLSSDGEPQETIRIGDTLIVPNENGSEVVARIEDIVSMGQDATAVVHDEAAHKRWLVTFPLSELEARAAARFTDAVFGKLGSRRHLRESDPFDLYDFFLEAYGNMTQEEANRLVEEDPGLREYKGLPLPEARVRVAREYTKSAWARRSHTEGEARGP